jgi:hypothetical protein
LEDQKKPLALSDEHASASHKRWIKNRNNWYPVEEGEDRPDEWYHKQCGQCRFYILLKGAGALTDWGVCSNPESLFDGRVMFEHDGCEEFSGADLWVSDYF